MFERYLTDAVTSRFGHVVENLDADQVRLSAWKGELVLQDLHLSPQALDAFMPDCPVQIAYGRVGHFELRIPWTLFRSQLKWRQNSDQPLLLSAPCSLVLSDVTILVTPKMKQTNTNSEPSDETESTDNKPSHQSRVDKENDVQSQLDAQMLRRVTESTVSSSTRWNWIRDWLSTLLSTLSITIRNIHVRYEDPGTCLGFLWTEASLAKDSVQRYRPAFALGITLLEFSVDSAPDDPRKPTSSSTSALLDTRRKRGVADKLAVYWDSTATLLADPKNPPDDWLLAFQALTVEGSHSLYNSHRYLLHPMSPRVDLTLVSPKSNGSGTLDPDAQPPDVPPSTVQIHLPPTQVTLAKATLEDIAYLRKSFSVWHQATKGLLSEESLQRLARLRPARAPGDDPISWWRYCMQASLELYRVHRYGQSVNPFHLPRRRGWVGFMEAFRRRKQYVAQYRAFQEYQTQENHEALLSLEDDLIPEEMVAFRTAAFEMFQPEQSTKDEPAVAKTSWQLWKRKPVEEKPPEASEDVLSLKHRISMMQEMVQALEREQSNRKEQVEEQVRKTHHGDVPEYNPHIWTASLACPEMALQVNDDSADVSSTRPVVRISSAIVQEQCWYRDGSFDLECALASLIVRDLTSAADSTFHRFYPHLIGRKGTASDVADDFVEIEGTKHFKGISISVRKKLHLTSPSGDAVFPPEDRGSTTETRIRVLPMEVVYSVVPVEVATRVLGTVKTPELVDDYHRMASAAHNWQRRQRQKLLEALAHKRKKIIVDVDISAPEFVIPEDVHHPESSMLAVDFGRLRLFNEELTEARQDFDDRWRLELRNVFVRKTQLSSQDREPISDSIVEPFSLEFDISTRIVSQANPGESGSTSVHVDATLPRLAFNLTSSSMQLMTRLRRQFRSKRKVSPPQVVSMRSVSMSKKVSLHESAENATKATSRLFVFDFTTPVIRVRMTNDTAQECDQDDAIPNGGIPLFDLALQGMRGKIQQETSEKGEVELTFDARLHSLGMIDLFQSAGVDFAMLLSSSQPALRKDIEQVGNFYTWRNLGVDSWEGHDMVSLQYSHLASAATGDEPLNDRVVIGFNELFVEWNPETIATVMKSMRNPIDTIPLVAETQSLSDDEFFDAVQAENTSASIMSLSEVSSSSFETADTDISSGLPFGLFHPFGRPSAQGFRSTVMPLSPHSTSYPLTTNAHHAGATDKDQRKPFEVVFKLAKLRVSFNKESRHRKVMVAQMDNTSVTYRTRSVGGSRTLMSIGNLTFVDPASVENNTLYGQILGLKTRGHGSSGEKPSSLLEMEIFINTRERIFQTIDEDCADSPTSLVTIDREQGKLIGCNLHVIAKFSPMRFVVLEQLWFEIVDYFFQGIVGTALWGPPSSRNQQIVEESGPKISDGALPGSEAKGMTITRFNISLQSPELVFPVTYRSPHFLRMDLSDIDISNRYAGSLVEGTQNDESGLPRMQWFNNCSIILRDLRLFSWSGRELGKFPVMASVSVQWPTGPGALLVIPKWRVKAEFESLSIALQREDYTLLQHILTHNIGEPSRHMDEWVSLQNLSASDFQAYLCSILVQFGYDKKDVTPTTYDVVVRIPSVRAELLNGIENDVRPIAVAQCLDVIWSLRKESDLIVRQRASCDVDLVAMSQKPVGSVQKLLSSWKYDHETLKDDIHMTNEHEDTPELVYTSTTLPSRDNTKTLEIVDACIYAHIPAWRRVSKFFSSLPMPLLFDSSEIASSIQVGDRWYKIGGFSGTGGTSQDSGLSQGKKFKWIPAHEPASASTIHNVNRVLPTFQLRILLTSPRIIMSALQDQTSVSRLIVRMSHLELLHVNSGQEDRISRFFVFDQVEMYTLSSSGSKRIAGSDENSLIRPWSIGGSITKGSHPEAQQTLRISGDRLRARAAYSDLVVALEVCLFIAHESKETSEIEAVSRIQSPRKSIQTQHDTQNKGTAPFGGGSQFDILCDGIEVCLADDSGRHFAGTQDLVVLSLGKLLFSQYRGKGGSSTLGLRLDTLELFDCLQHNNSPFRAVASTRGNTGESASRSTGGRKLLWDSMRSQECGLAKYTVSPDLMERLGSDASECSDVHNDEAISTPNALLFLLDSSDAANQELKVAIPSLSVQWNPSTVIAIQRFLGRLKKDAKARIGQIFELGMNDLIKNGPATNSEDLDQASSVPSSFHVVLQLDRLVVCLNKEHQNRRLLELVVQSSHLVLDKSNLGQNGMIVTGGVKDFAIQDRDSYESGIVDVNRSVLKVVHSTDETRTNDSSEFMSFHYRTFSNYHGDNIPEAGLPQWIVRHVSEIGGIDDFLSLKVAGVQFTYLKERTEELVDYLSNGLPGKGMGATSRAAKGFLSKRIQTKSFLEFQNRSPRVLLLQHETACDALALNLGGVSIRSYFDNRQLKSGDAGLTESATTRWWRILSFRLSGFQACVLKDSVLSPLTQTMKLTIDVQKPTSIGGKLCVQGKLSFVDLILKYSDYVLIRNVINSNIGRQVDTTKWDNVEKAYWLEGEGGHNTSYMSDDEDTSDPVNATHVMYSSNARFVRYGKAGRRKARNPDDDHDRTQNGGSANNSSGSETGGVDVVFGVDGLSVKLSRDDSIDSILGEELEAAFKYDILLLRVKTVEISLTVSSTGDTSFRLSLFRLGLFDLGDQGRLVRERFYSNMRNGSHDQKEIRAPCPFQILAEGYAGNSGHSGNPVPDEVESPQIVVSLDRCPVSSAQTSGGLKDVNLPRDTPTTTVKVVVNFLSLNVFIRPFKEVASFLSCEWPIDGKHNFSLSRVSTSNTKGRQSTGPSFRSSVLQLKVVANYPRIIFPADESDVHSRALVLRGLAVLNASQVTKAVSVNTERLLSANVQLHSMESYINPDVYSALCFKSNNADMVGAGNLSAFPDPDDGWSEDAEHTLGVALIQPVTTGIEYQETRKPLFPTMRSVFITVEPVATLLSFEDLNLIETVLHRLSRSRNTNSLGHEAGTRTFDTVPSTRNRTYEVDFFTERLGLGLKSDKGKIVVNSLQRINLQHRIQVGDCLLSIDNVNVANFKLDDVVRRLSVPKRPITLQFYGKGSSDSSSNCKGIQENGVEGNGTRQDDASRPEYYLASYTLRFKRGVPNGLVFERSSCAQLPVVKSIQPGIKTALAGEVVDDSHDEQIEATFKDILDPPIRRIPSAGALVVAIDDVKVQEAGVDEIWRVISDLDHTSGGKTTNGEHVSQRRYYSLTFRELDARLLGTIDSIGISSSGFALSFIDDLNGRDMPLFRVKVHALELRGERGFGGECQIITVLPPEFVHLDASQVSESDNTNTRILIDEEKVEEFKATRVVSLSVISSCSIDYFHPRIAFWEPLLENSQLYLLVEKQNGSPLSSSPGQTAIEISDRLLHVQSFRGNVIPNLGQTPQILSVNLTDAAILVLVKANKQWKEWRKSASAQNNDSLAEDPEFESVTDNASVSLSMASYENAPTDTFSVVGRNESGSPRVNRTQEARRVAAKKAVQGALSFAQKRGADKNEKSVSAKPFVFRNRTGVAIAFLQEDPNEKNRSPGPTRFSMGNLPGGVGEYTGLLRNSLASIQEVADQEDAKFNMEIISDSSQGTSDVDSAVTHLASKKVRNYEGHFPSLTVAIQAVSGVFVEPLVGLQVFKVGISVHHLVVSKETGTGEKLMTYTIPVIWKVELDDNRRILTLSTAVRVMTSALNTQIEVGVSRPSSEAAREIQLVGTAKPGHPFYMPLWLALKLEPADIFVRPRVQGQAVRFNWGSSSILRFGPLFSFSNEIEGLRLEDSGTWVWEETFGEVSYVCCRPMQQTGLPIWLAVFGGSTAALDRTGPVEANTKQSSGDFEEGSGEVISVTLDSSITLRNMLPMDLEWQLATASLEESPVAVVDGSWERQDVSNRFGIALQSGGCTEIFACEYGIGDLKARFRESKGQHWSSWASLSACDDSLDFENSEDDIDSSLKSILPVARQETVQVPNDRLGIPLTLGVRMVQKITSYNVGTYQRARTYGVEVVVFAELWIQNFTTLPLNFGCPSHQLHSDKSNTKGTSQDTVSKFNAESALMEIANLLEVGEKGTGLSRKGAQEAAETGTMESLPNQECTELTEEIFEYLEIEYSTVKRRWWASDSYDSYRPNITQSEEDPNWTWVDDRWIIDTSGDVEASMGGWESCRNLLGGIGSFSGRRSFDATHAIRRRRFFRTRTGRKGMSSRLHGGLQAIHQPIYDSFTREQKKLGMKKKQSKGPRPAVVDGPQSDELVSTKISVKCGGGKWCMPAIIPDTGTSHGALRVLASRWPALSASKQNSNEPSLSSDLLTDLRYKSADLSPCLYELCYTVGDVEGEWGEFSRTMSVSSRFLVRNDSPSLCFKVKQAGAPDSTAVSLTPGDVQPFYWADFRLPGLVCVTPCSSTDDEPGVYRWSGGFDICNLGMVPLRIRRIASKEGAAPLVRSVKALVEIRPGTGGFGINITFREEDPLGDGALFRVENESPFPVWISQDGVLANPSAVMGDSPRGTPVSGGVEQLISRDDIDVIRPQERKSFGLDVPYRQGKYAHRKEASIGELLRARLALAPFSHRSGIETVKVLGLTTVGESVRLNPSKLFGIVDQETRYRLRSLRVLGIISSDGPTRVLKLLLMNVPVQDIFSNPFPEVSYGAADNPSTSVSNSPPTSDSIFDEVRMGVSIALGRIESKEVLEENEAKRVALLSELDPDLKNAMAGVPRKDDGEKDQIFSIRAEFSGFLISLVDDVPSEIAVASMRNINALGRWNSVRTTDASLIVSIGWLQVDNHVPSAPFKVAIKPHLGLKLDALAGDSSDQDSNVDITTPLLVIAIALAPKHKSGIVCLRSVTIAPRNLAIAVDLAFLVRLQRFFLGIKNHLRQSSSSEEKHSSDVSGNLGTFEQRRSIPVPTVLTHNGESLENAAFGSENQKLYFQSLTILPTALSLSVAPARALTPFQASLEGKEVAAIHQAVRKGDVLVGSSSALLGVRVGRKNTTPLAVVRGVLKSIVVDALLRLDGASLTFSGVSLRNHMSSAPQLSTYLTAHYLASLRQNVPALLGSLAAFGNPLGLIRGLGDGVSDFVSEPVRGLKKSVKELDPSYLVDGVARGTGSLARHAVGGFADSASLLTETFSKNMAVLTLDRRYAQKRDRNKQLRLNSETTVTLAGGVESGFVKLVQGFLDGVTGVVKAPIRGAERKGIEGFAKGIGKGLLGLLVKPVIGISDAATDVMIGVKNTMEKSGDPKRGQTLVNDQIRPRRPFYGRDKVLRPYKLEDAAAMALMLRTRCAGENYLSHLDMRDRVALLSVKRFVMLGPKGEELMSLKYKHVSRLEVRKIPNEDGSIGWAIIILLNTPRKNGSEVEVLTGPSEEEVRELCEHIQRGVDIVKGKIDTYQAIGL